MFCVSIAHFVDLHTTSNTEVAFANGA